MLIIMCCRKRRDGAIKEEAKKNNIPTAITTRIIYAKVMFIIIDLAMRDNKLVYI